MRRAAGLLRQLARFFRFPSLGATLAVMLLGLACDSRHPSGMQLGIVLAVGVLFHIGVYVLNDVVDVDIDRTDPRRVGSPLTVGEVSVSTALLVAAVCLLAGVGLLRWTASTAAVTYFVLGAVGLGVYDVFGKRCSFPPAIDMIQGAGWACLLLAGSAVGGSTTLAATLLGCSVCAHVMVVTGIPAGLRDLANDARHGARTTALLFVPAAALPGRLPRGYVSYGLVLHAISAISGVGGVLALRSQQPPTLIGVSLSIAVLGQLGSFAALWYGTWCYRADRVGARLGLVYVLLPWWSLLVAVFIRYGLLPALLTVVLPLAPWLGSRVVQSILVGTAGWAGAGDVG